MEKQFPYKNGETLKDSSYLCVSYEKREPIPIASMKHWLKKLAFSYISYILSNLDSIFCHFIH